MKSKVSEQANVLVHYFLLFVQFGLQPLHLLCTHKGLVEAIALLIQEGADVTAFDKVNE